MIYSDKLQKMSLACAHLSTSTTMTTKTTDLRMAMGWDGLARERNQVNRESYRSLGVSRSKSSAAWLAHRPGRARFLLRVMTYLS